MRYAALLGWGSGMRIGQLKRRQFITLLGGAAAWPLAARAQRAERVLRVGVLEAISQDQNVRNFGALQKGLREAGYVEGRNLTIYYRSANGASGRFPALAAELVSLGVNVIVTRGTPAVLAAKNATAAIPIVMAASGEPTGTGAVAGLAHPGGNVTGLSSFTTELETKRIELLRELVPGAKRLGALINIGNPVSERRWRVIDATAQSIGIPALLLDVRTPLDLTHAFETAGRQNLDGLLVGNEGLIQANNRLIADLAIRNRLPAIYAFRDVIDAGGLISYSVNYADLYFRAATFVNKIFKGARPTDLPVEQPTKFELIVNLKTAKAIGLAVSESFLLRADEVIE
jgi:putative ABC transport system substrate-binding protein